MSSNDNRDRVARAFLAGKYARSGHMVSVENRLYSYAHALAYTYHGHTPQDAAFVVVDQSCERCHSRTTATHAAALRRALEASGWQLEHATTDSDLWIAPID